MTTPFRFLGVDIGTSSSKGVVVDDSGAIIADAVREHEVSRPFTGHVEMDARIWWDEFVSIASELSAAAESPISAVGVSGMGPCVLLTDAHGTPLRPAILYGVDTRATVQIERLTAQFGAEDVLARCGSALSTQAVGPKLAWIEEHEPDIFAKARRLFMPSSWLAWNLTDNYILDHHSASQSTPLYDTNALDWYEPWSALLAPSIELPALVWPRDIAGTITGKAAKLTGLPEGIPVIAGTIDAWSEAISIGAQQPGDLMLMYGTTMFLINTLDHRVTVPELWGTVGAFEGTRNLAGGMATSGAITSWLKTLIGTMDFEALTASAAESPPGARGLVMLPYFAGERTPIADPNARGVIAGLTLQHNAGDLYRAALEATAMGVRHNIEAIESAGGDIRRIVAVGGGTQGGLWAQIVSDVTGRAQEVPRVTVGASYGAAFLAARTLVDADIELWNPRATTVVPDASRAGGYDRQYELYRELYSATSEIVHELARRQATL
ncbi:MAG: FGGY-family carbohydrate kinase [Cryobacterium sp.]|nr:FGGY-family carbohydrate kinase [Cryobacterium sp.]